tara:strand:- start:1007 stop:1759 length:753 start_codon:yes stop_codon:yes gene_type:complete
MAFLGDFGKFFGLGSSEQVLGSAGQTVGSLFGPGAGLVGKELGQATGRATSNLAGTADQPSSQSALPTPPARRGIDSGFQETNQSGNQMQNQAFIGGLSPLIQGASKLLAPASRFLQSPGGSALGIATGVGSVLGSSMGMGSREKPVLTQSRRNKSKVRQLVMFMGIEGTSDFLSQQGGQNVSPNDVVSLLLRTFRNDGAYITKAQVRNLRRTTNRFKSLEKQVKEAVSMGTTRRAPVRRTVNRSTSIKI